MTQKRIAIAFVVYSVAASSIGAALVARSMNIHGQPTFLRLLLWQAPPYVLWGLLVPLVARLTRVRRPLVALLLAIPLLVAAMSAFNVWWLQAAHPDPAFAAARAPSFIQRVYARSPVDLLIGSFVAAAVLAYRWMERAASSAAAQLRAEQQLAAAQLAAMKSRLQPHFLFNTLHTIKTLVGKEPERAERMIQDLSELLRLTLERRDQQLTTVAGELEAVRLYLAIQKERFGDRLSVRESIDESALPCLVPDMLLQPLAENAVVHGIAPLRRGGTISIDIRADGRLRIAIADDGAGVAGDFEEGIGLGATRERLGQLYGGDCRFAIEPRASGGTLVSIDLPLRRGSRG